MSSVLRRRRAGSSPLARGLRAPGAGQLVGSGIIPARAGFTAHRRRLLPRAGDHPRSRGVYAGSRARGSTAPGSSPLARGLLVAPGVAVGWAGIIPARAGFTGLSLPTRSDGRDHPRSRGVYSRSAGRTSLVRGSSPLARGLRLHSARHTCATRIIPARAGFTPRGPGMAARHRDHPRSRGVYRICGRELAGWRGSSPLARGLPREGETMSMNRRIIPARAGFTTPEPAPGPDPRDHPRSRGVYARAIAERRPSSGSSPLARGLLQLDSDSPPPQRIIPARAGFTSLASSPTGRRWDHSRSRGVYVTDDARRDRHQGSSPLARGLHPGDGARRARLGIIPARAGFTRRSGTNPPRPSDHPRSRGVYEKAVRNTIHGDGSSPLARGLRAGQHADAQGRGIIPARAGFTQNDGLVSFQTRGSSPLARGLRSGTAAGEAGGGIIPARAGFTGAGQGRGVRLPDHPRSRGVYSLMVPSRSASFGSSPLARGLPLVDDVDTGLAGIIPARAGFTPSARLRGDHRRDHPRSRGVYRSTSSPRLVSVGSSPLARGLLIGLPDPEPSTGIIPARAGFTPPGESNPRCDQDHPRSRGVYTNRAWPV